MKESILTQITQLEKMSIKELKVKYQELFGDFGLPQNNKVYLFRRIAHKIQELEYGGISDPAKDRIKELVLEFDPLSSLGKKKTTVKITQIANKPTRDQRLPLPGTVIIKHYKDTTIEVKALEKGFEYNGKVYKSLSKIASEVTGSHWSGFAFFNL